MPKRLIVILVLLLSSYAFGKDDDNAQYQVFAKPHEEYEVRDNAIYYRMGDGGMIFEFATGESIAKYYADRGAAHLGNPFAKSPELGTCSIFLVTLLNRTHGDLTFTPGYVVMKVGDAASFPMDFTTLLGPLERYTPDVQKILDKSIFHSPETVRSGQVISKFLFYPDLPRKNVDFRLEIDHLFFKDKGVRTVFHWMIRKKKP